MTTRDARFQDRPRINRAGTVTYNGHEIGTVHQESPVHFPGTCWVARDAGENVVLAQRLRRRDAVDAIVRHHLARVALARLPENMADLEYHPTPLPQVGNVHVGDSIQYGHCAPVVVTRVRRSGSRVRLEWDGGWAAFQITERIRCTAGRSSVPFAGFPPEVVQSIRNSRAGGPRSSLADPWGTLATR
jgi:hypothetical protein